MSEVSIYNQALSFLGQDAVMSLDPQAGRIERLGDTNYAPLRDAVLEEGAWTFATRRLVLTPVLETPGYGYGQKFLLPSTVLVVIEAGSNDFITNGPTDLDWRREEDFIVADATRVYAKCVMQITDTQKFTRTFTQALAARIAAEIAPNLTESNTKSQQMWTLYERKLAIALPVDGRQGKSDRIRGRSLTRVR